MNVDDFQAGTTGSEQLKARFALRSIGATRGRSKPRVGAAFEVQNL
jgi:hypothetical protein